MRKPFIPQSRKKTLFSLIFRMAKPEVLLRLKKFRLLWQSLLRKKGKTLEEEVKAYKLMTEMQKQNWGNVIKIVSSNVALMLFSKDTLKSCFAVVFLCRNRTEFRLYRISFSPWMDRTIAEKPLGGPSYFPCFFLLFLSIAGILEIPAFVTPNIRYSLDPYRLDCFKDNIIFTDRWR